MRKRVTTKIGDIFEVRISPETKKFFQLIAFDLAQLNSDVIRSFATEHEITDVPNSRQIVQGDVEFYAHCSTRLGVKLGYWEKHGASDNVGEIGHILFRGTEDYATAPGEKPIMVSNKWYVWRIGDNDFTYVGELKGENRKAEIGLVFDPESIVHRIRNGKYQWSYPDFE